jgi:hypothetical protein
MKGRYHLYTDETGMYSTNSYETYILYLKVFDYTKYKRIMYPRSPKSHVLPDPGFPSDGESFKTALKQEQRLFDCGLCPRLVPIEKNGKTCLYCKWVEVSE